MTPSAHSLTHSLTHSLAHSLARSLALTHCALLSNEPDHIGAPLARRLPPAEQRRPRRAVPRGRHVGRAAPPRPHREHRERRRRRRRCERQRQGQPRCSRRQQSVAGGAVRPAPRRGRPAPAQRAAPAAARARAAAVAPRGRRRRERRHGGARRRGHHRARAPAAAAGDGLPARNAAAVAAGRLHGGRHPGRSLDAALRREAARLVAKWRPVALRSHRPSLMPRAPLLQLPQPVHEPRRPRHAPR